MVPRFSGRAVLCVSIGFLAGSLLARAEAGGSCKELEQIVAVETAPGEAVRLLEDSVKQVGATCAGTILLSMAQAAAADGRLDDVARYAERSVRILEAEHSPDDPALMRPLALGAAANFELNNRTKARRLLDRMRGLRPRGSEEKALVHSVSARLLRAEGKLRDAEAEARAAVSEQEAAGGLKSVDQVWLLHQLSAICIEQERYDDARTIVERAGRIVDLAPDALPMDRLRIHELVGLVSARQNRWADAQREFANALAIADGTPTFDPEIIRGVLSNYVIVLKKAGQGRAAKTAEKRLAGMPASPPANTVVDVNDLARQRAE